MSTDEHLPPFLRNVSEEARKEFYEIAHDKKTPLVELRKHMEEWAKKQGDAVVNEMHNFETSKRQHQIATHKKVNVVIGQLTRAHNEVRLTTYMF
ncbi:hypothetical protein NECAME_15940 [Necator americanus]|uniref:SXP/RAL-2 family protein Ani s 5-like cation-binding domain-containing protein n=1 Tax=Necator americanus TaxID=51031 RepID=W2SF83_NECAM|nr:hypothetical protein NECAME_15940 [Necator americanus]ETN68240.1 hypothetical protein NECAME_15940 [Necator americanus]